VADVAELPALVIDALALALDAVDALVAELLLALAAAAKALADVLDTDAALAWVVAVTALAAELTA
jgi:hypothetical protein